jgi:hypothetical protein
MWMAHGFQGTADKPGNDNEGDENQESEEGNG